MPYLYLLLIRLLQLLLLAVAIAIVVLAPERSLGRPLWKITRLILLFLSYPFLAARWLVAVQRPEQCRAHGVFCRCPDCHAHEEEMDRLWEDEDDD
jgi:hypothetical protein